MPSDKLRCPECDGILRLAKPPAPGKKIKCPKCGAKFELADEPAPPAMSKSKAGVNKKDAGVSKKDKDKVTAKKADKPAAKAEKAAPKLQDDDDEGGGTYGFVKEDEAEEENKPKISYAPDTSVRDLRGPAQEAVMRPTNIIIMCGALGFFGWLALMVMLLIPILFPIIADEGTKGDPVKVLSFTDGLVRWAREERLLKRKSLTRRGCFFSALTWQSSVSTHPS